MNIFFAVTSLFALATTTLARELRGSRSLVGDVVGFELINVNDNSVYATLLDGDTIFLDGFTPNFNVKAVIAGTDTRMVRFDFNGVNNFRTEGKAPYALCGDRPTGVYLRCPLLVAGQHTVTATPIAADAITEGASLTITFTIAEGSAPTDSPTDSPTMAPVAAPVTPPSADYELFLINADTDTVIEQITEGAVIEVSQPANLNLEARFPTSTPGSVLFGINDKPTFRTDGKPPYALCRDDAGDFITCRPLKIQTHSVSVTPFSGKKRTGTQGPTLTINFEIVLEGTDPPTPAPVSLAPVSDAPTSDAPTSDAPTSDAPTIAPVSIAPKWIEVDSDAPISERHEACFVMAGDVAVLIGGRRRQPVKIYDPVTRAWTTGEDVPFTNQIHHMQCVYAQSKVWIMAAWKTGFPTEVASEFVYAYDVGADSWETFDNLPVGRRRGATAVVVSADEFAIFVSHGNIGGHESLDADHAVSVGFLDRYDITTNTWTALSDAPNPRDHTGGALVGNRICVAAGRNGGINDSTNGRWPTVGTTDCYDIGSDTWVEEAPIPVERAGSAYGQSCDGKLIVAGGEAPGNAFDDVSVFDGTTWTAMPTLARGRHGTGLAVNCNCDQIHIAAGGLSPGGSMETTSVETFFPSGIDTPCTPV